MFPQNIDEVPRFLVTQDDFADLKEILQAQHEETKMVLYGNGRHGLIWQVTTLSTQFKMVAGFVIFIQPIGLLALGVWLNKVWGG